MGAKREWVLMICSPCGWLELMPGNGEMQRMDGPAPLAQMRWVQKTY
uniref:Uncharacterized protein n=1 Tax=Picea glauca TaxID=3330 RepID=A0A101M406_PICGL|nr:hypothetical protein ABT39_MTgene515 [Picea glauca]